MEVTKDNNNEKNALIVNMIICVMTIQFWTIKKKMPVCLHFFKDL